MYIFLDESKHIIWEKWQFIFWWLVTTFKPYNFIEYFVNQEIIFLKLK